MVKALPKARGIRPTLWRDLARVPGWVVHPFRVVKRLFRYRDAAFPGIGEEHRAAADLVRAGESVDRAEGAARGNAGLTTAGARHGPKKNPADPTKPLKCRPQTSIRDPPPPEPSPSRWTVSRCSLVQCSLSSPAQPCGVIVKLSALTLGNIIEPKRASTHSPLPGVDPRLTAIVPVIPLVIPAFAVLDGR